MFTTLELVDKIALVILRYIKERDDKFPDTSPQHYLNHLKSEKNLINGLNACIQSSDKVTTRRPLLEYLLQKMTQLQTLDLQRPLEQEVTNQLNDQLITFIRDLQNLLNKNQYSTVSININGKNEEVYGVRGLMYGTSLAGSLIKEELFQKLQLTESSSEEEVRSAITNVLDETQNYIKIQVQQKDITILREEKQQLLDEVTKLQMQQGKLESRLSVTQASQRLFYKASLGTKETPYGASKDQDATLTINRLI